MNQRLLEIYILTFLSTASTKLGSRILWMSMPLSLCMPLELLNCCVRVCPGIVSHAKPFSLQLDNTVVPALVSKSVQLANSV